MKSHRLRSLAWLVIISVLLATLGLWGLRQIAGDRLPDLTTERFEQARSSWQSSPADDYSITTVVRGRQPATYKVDVRSGVPLAAYRNGEPLQDRRTFKTWTVDGMFGTMEYDVDRNAMAEREGEKPLSLSARFDPDWQFPAKYRRIEWGTSFEVEWEVTEFALRKSTDEVMP